MRRRTGWRKRLLHLLIVPPLLTSAAELHACLETAAPEYAEIVAEFQAGDQPESWEYLDRSKPGRAAILTALGDAYIDQARFPEAEETLEQAIVGWLEENHVPGELCSRRLLAVAQGRRRALRDGLATISLAEARAQDTGETSQLNSIIYTKISLLLNLNERLEEALLQLEQHPPGDDTSEKVRWALYQAALFGRLGRLRQSVAAYERVIETATEPDTESLRTAAIGNRVRLLFTLAESHPEAIDLAELATEAEGIIEAPASPTQSRLMAMLFLANLRRTAPEQKPLEDCYELAVETNHPHYAGACLAHLALAKGDTEPERAAELMEQAAALAERTGSARDQHRLVWMRILLDWKLHRPPEAMRRSLTYIADTEALRREQSAGEARARFLALWSYIDHLLAGLAYAHADEYPELLEQAFMVLENSRARVLRELRLDANDPADAARTAAQRISGIQRALLESPVEPGRSEQLHEQLRRLDLEYRQALLREPETLPDPGPPPDIGAVQATLEPEEALLLALTNTELWETRDTGWVQVITRDQTFAVQIPGHVQLAQWSRTLNGLDDWSTPRARRMFDIVGAALLEPVLRRLPEQTKRLILVPDKGLHNLPVAALTLPGGNPLGAVFELEIAPSAGLWLALRESHKARHGSVLVLADPELPVDGYRRLDPVFAERLEPLPSARDEAKRIRARLGSKAEVLLGSKASESVLGENGLERHSLLHFGTHTLIHPTVAHRSAILLAPSDGETDGLLQPREIPHLDLDGRAAILAVCSGAAGEWVDGEGLLSLARAFIAAGAPAVVASQWPVDDRHAQVYFDRVYRQLARGQTLSAALNRANRDLHDAGYPPEAWAGYILIGDGAWSPVEPVRPWHGLAWLTAGLMLLLSIVVREVVRRRR